jgi:hypothetical protein
MHHIGTQTDIFCRIYNLSYKCIGQDLFPAPSPAATIAVSSTLVPASWPVSRFAAPTAGYAAATVMHDSPGAHVGVTAWHGG